MYQNLLHLIVMVELLVGVVALVLMFLPHYFWGDINFDSWKNAILVLMMVVWMAVIGGLYIKAFF